MDKENIIELTGEDGDVLKAEYLDTVLVDDQEYVVMVPVGEEGCEDGCDCGGCDSCGETEVIIMKVQKNGDEEFLIPVEDDEELERAFVAFQEQSEFCEDDEDEEEDEDGEEK
jgi:hypothetical protein